MNLPCNLKGCEASKTSRFSRFPKRFVGMTNDGSKLVEVKLNE